MGRASTEVLEIGQSSLECRVLSPQISDDDVDFFVESHNGDWGDFFVLDRETFRRRLESNHLFVAAYAGGIPLGLLETIATEIDESNLKPPAFGEASYRMKAFNVCEISPQGYMPLTNSGQWKTFKSGANVLWLIDITVLPQYRNYHIGSKMVHYVLSELLSNSSIEQLRDIKYALTFTPTESPDIELGRHTLEPSPGNLSRFHYSNGAFDTNYRMRNARPGHRLPHVGPWCYLTPEYKDILKDKLMKKLKDINPT